jgi:hypothetical protein
VRRRSQPDGKPVPQVTTAVDAAAASSAEEQRPSPWAWPRSGRLWLTSSVLRAPTEAAGAASTVREWTDLGYEEEEQEAREEP